ncbi:hypothetical protein L6452_39118 [Arctium lappa]|uniref:Uncharacterized protein n=1 Tax=Arctium lappa TaxID=4217 RepID=A0ACB8XSB2_ARCLA|nr:hypothetical protein L6452_39118 [Arctium lappa]
MLDHCLVFDIYIQVMDANNDNFGPSDASKKSKPKVLWDHSTFMVFIDLCMNEVKNGNRPGSHFNKVGWGNIEKKIKERTGKCFDRKQLKNKWDTMKKDWKLYDRLMRIESGIGWDPVRKTLNATDEWWDEKIKGNKDIAKFRDLNLEIFQLYYEPLFRDSVAVGDRTKVPVDFQNNSGPINVHDEEVNEGKGDSDEVHLDEDDEPLSPFPQSSSSKRKNPNNVAPTRSTKGKSAVSSTYEEKLDTILEALSTRSTQSFPQRNLVPTPQECMDIVKCFPGFEEGSRMYCKALGIFLKEQTRVNFMVPTSDVEKMEFLKFLMEG